ncbi:MAG: segregation/condensation protein A [Candidatus Pacearchaeota archaeon]|jgi:segregation and condensation protein A
MTEHEKIGQEQFQSFVFGEKLSWQEIIYDLINSEQLDPWDIDLVLLSQKYMEKIRELEEANFTISSKVLIVSSLLLRIKSELLINRYLKDLDDILFKRKEEVQETLKLPEFEEDEIPQLLPRTPLPRFKKISLTELMAALNKAVETESRRIVRKNMEKEVYEKTKFFMPKNSMSLVERIKIIHERIKNVFQTQEKIKFSEFAGQERQERINTFIPLLHLDTQSKLWLEQEKHLEEIWILKERLKKFDNENDIITNTIETEFEEGLERIEGIEYEDEIEKK